ATTEIYTLSLHDALPISAEAHAVDAGEERNAPAEVRMREHPHRTGLREGLDHQHAGHDRLARKVPAQEPLVATHGEACTDARARLQLHDLVDQQEGVAVRDDRLDLRAPERCCESSAHAEPVRPGSSRSTAAPDCQTRGDPGSPNTMRLL